MLIGFILSVAAGILANLICHFIGKWLDRKRNEDD